MDITSRFDGKIVKLYYEEGDTARVGAPLVDVDVEDDEVGKQRLQPAFLQSGQHFGVGGAGVGRGKRSSPFCFPHTRSRYLCDRGAGRGRRARGGHGAVARGSLRPRRTAHTDQRQGQGKRASLLIRQMASRLDK